MEKKKKILLIDDEEAMCVLVKLNLEGTGEYEVDTATSGAEGIAKVKAGDFDLVITDLLMPEMSGKNVLKAVKAIKPNTLVMICSAYYDGQSRMGSPDMDKVDGHITKPIDCTDMRKAIYDIFNKKSRP